MGCYGLAGSLYDAIALAGAFGPGSRLGFGAAEAGMSDILVPAGASLVRAEIAAAAGLGRDRYFFSFGNYDASDVAPLAGAIEHLAAATGLGFMAACLASPEMGRTVYQGQLFEGGKIRFDLVREFSLAMEGGVGLVARDIVAGGPGAIAQQCGRLKEQGKVLALIDAIDDDDYAAVATAMAGFKLAGGVAGLADAGGSFPADAATGRVAILSGARDRQSIFQIGAARGAIPVFDLDVAAADPAAAALAWVAAAMPAGAFIITSSAPPDRLIQGAAASAVLGGIAAGLAAMGVKRFIIAGGETGQAVRAALGIATLSAVSATGPLLWLANDNVSISFKAPGSGAKNLFLSEFEPHLRLNDIAELAS